MKSTVSAGRSMNANVSIVPTNIPQTTEFCFEIQCFRPPTFQLMKWQMKNNIPIVDIRRNAEWDQTGVVPKSILLTFFDKEGNYNYNEWYEKLRLEIGEGKPIILICRTGRRTKIIAKMMEIKNFDNVIYNAKSGITSWIDEKLITVKPKY